ncbi:MAG: group II intron reverse transcriptase/maturase [Planctomycetes bacterium]|nr:group II intron reverse transcriptase/maturase [Planctomycetota bacterium]
MVFTSLAHFIDIDFLRAAYARTRKDGATGIDGQTADAYGANLEENLQSLLDRFKSGAYHAPPVRRVYIPKGDGRKQRPIGIPTFEDKVLQRAVAMILEAVYEQDFLECSFGFRPGRSAHQALAKLREGLTSMRGGWVLDMDIRAFFDTLDHGHLRGFLDQRVRDGVLRRAIDKWLAAGVLEAGNVNRPEGGTPQGGVISPLLANIYLHAVLDEWFHNQVLPCMRAPAFLIRYADDAVLVFTLEKDAQRVMEVLPKRLGRFGLSLHPEKTRLVRFLRPPILRPANRREGSKTADPNRQGTFVFLGFTHHWGRTLRGGWAVRQKTAASRFGRTMKAVNKWLRDHRHWPIEAQHQMLVRKLQGHFAYFGISSNGARIRALRELVLQLWRKWLNRRSQRKCMPWYRYLRLLERYPLPRARIVHTYVRPAANP